MDRLKSFGFLLKDLARRHVQRFEQRASELNLTLMQCKALIALERQEGVSQARLAEVTDVDPMTMVRILDHMESDKLVERRLDPEDRRARQLFLTDKARSLVAKVWEVADVTRGEFFVGVPAADRDTFMRVLEQIHANAAALTGQPAAPVPAPEPRPTSQARRAKPASRTADSSN